jgi:16S rRNA (cytosine967-C5)-methyltransferase
LLSWQGVAALEARRLAFDLLLRVEREGAYSDELLHSKRLAGIGVRAKAFVTATVLGCLRRQGELDHLISVRTTRPLGSMDTEVLIALRLGAYQLRHMDGIPDHAAVSESVELVKRARKGSAAGMVNAILRHLPPALPQEESGRLCHPDWLLRRWRKAFGDGKYGALLQANLRQPATYFRLRSSADAAKVRASLESAGVSAEPTDLARAYRLAKGSVPAAREVAGDAIVFQDINSQRVGALLAGPSCTPVLDVCAAPGGKSRMLAETAAVVAGDRRVKRLQAMRRLGSRGIQLLALDAECPLPFRRQFDRILVDAPCSGTGTLARNPEIKWRLAPDDLDALSARQGRILENAMDALAPGGRLVYATCSLEPEENQHVVAKAIGERPGWEAAKALATVPGTDPGDGFQAWRIRRPAV